MLSEEIRGYSARLYLQSLIKRPGVTLIINLMAADERVDVVARLTGPDLDIEFREPVGGFPTDHLKNQIILLAG